MQDVDRGTGLFDYWVEEFQSSLRKRRVKVDGGGVVVYRIAMFQYQGHRSPGIKKSTPQSRRNLSKFCESGHWGCTPPPFCFSVAGVLFFFFFGILPLAFEGDSSVPVVCVRSQRHHLPLAGHAQSGGP